jgi:hypothetical protein
MRKLSFTIEHGMVKDGKGVVDVLLGNQVIVRVGNDTEKGISLRSGTKLALAMAAERLRELADRMDSEAKNG